MKLIAISDLHLPSLIKSIVSTDANGNFLKAISAIRNRQFDALLILGDIAYKNANKHSYQLCSKGLTAITQDIYCLPGNHDEWDLLYKIMHPHLKNTTHCFEQQFGSAPFLFLDSSSGEISKKYVEQFLHNHTNQAVFLCAHHPIVPTQAQYMEQRYALRNKQEVLDLLSSHSAPVTVVSGHYHCSIESSYKNVRQIVVPSLLYQIPPGAQKFAIDRRFGFCEITISENSEFDVKTEWV